MTWRELSKLRHRDSGEQMPLLAQVLEAFPDMYFNIDAKAKALIVFSGASSLPPRCAKTSGPLTHGDGHHEQDSCPR